MCQDLGNHDKIKFLKEYENRKIRINKSNRSATSGFKNT
jgi:hypothetical protein